jgi:leucyl/phenylalanyl-tRNA--protein transferase
LPFAESRGNFLPVIEPELLLGAYARGIFPMAMPEGEIGWFSPDPRGVLPLEGFHVPHGLARRLRKNPFEIRINTAFAEVMRGCAQREETWIDAEITASYQRLHELGFAHSVETWREERLVGGLYGVSLGGVFFGESMFHRETDASKVALHALILRMKERGFALLDIQWITPHLATFGAAEIPRRDYLRQLRAAIEKECDFG